MYKYEEPKSHTGTWIVVIIVAILGIIFFTSSFASIDEGEIGLVTRFGKTVKVVQPGLQNIGLMNDLTRFQTRNNKYETTASAGTIDLQSAVMQIAVNYSIDQNKIPEIYKTFGQNYLDRIFTQNVQESVKSVTSKYQASELITKRDEVKSKIKDKLIETVNAYVTITDVSVVNIDFSDSFDAAIESKVVAEQKALEAQKKLEQSKYEAEAIRVQAEAIKQSGGAEYVQLKAIEKWNGQLPTYSGGQLPFLNLPTGR